MYYPDETFSWKVEEPYQELYKGSFDRKLTRQNAQEYVDLNVKFALN